MRNSQVGPLEVETALELGHALQLGIKPSGIGRQEAQRWISQPDASKNAIAYLLKLDPVEALRRLRNVNWIEELVLSENAAHEAFFGCSRDLSFFKEVLDGFGEERVRQWRNLGLEPHYWPNAVFAKDAVFPGWEVRPNNWSYEQVAAGNIKRRNTAGNLSAITQVAFPGAVLLVDTRLKPSYNGGEQMFDNDKQFLGKEIERLRKEGKMDRYEYGPQTSRFGISSREWDEHLCPALAARPEFEGITWMFEPYIVANVVPQLYPHMLRVKDGQTDTWVWYEEYFGGESRRLDGGYSGRGGLAYVDCRGVGIRWSGRAVRPLGVLATQIVGS